MAPKIGVIPGDPSGIGPELVARLLADDCAKDANILLIGDRHVFDHAVHRSPAPPAQLLLSRRLRRRLGRAGC